MLHLLGAYLAAAGEGGQHVRGAQQGGVYVGHGCSFPMRRTKCSMAPAAHGGNPG